MCVDNFTDTNPLTQKGHLQLSLVHDDVKRYYNTINEPCLGEHLEPCPASARRTNIDLV